MSDPLYADRIHGNALPAAYRCSGALERRLAFSSQPACQDVASTGAPGAASYRYAADGSVIKRMNEAGSVSIRGQDSLARCVSTGCCLFDLKFALGINRLENFHRFHVPLLRTE